MRKFGRLAECMLRIGRADGLSSPRLWAFRTRDLSRLSLDVNGEPFPIHVDIVGWPEEKDARMMKATEVADKLKLELAPVE